MSSGIFPFSSSPIQSKSEQISVASGVTTQDGTAGFIPAGAHLLGIAFRVDVQPAGPATFQAGTSGVPSAYLGTSTTVVPGSFVLGGPSASVGTTFGEWMKDSARTIRLTFNALTSNAAGRITVQIWYFLPSP